ncbi:MULTISPECIES: flagellar hook protein FlgE [unclassified Cryobacterium]|uniref:flagellar hook protein FlgE n=1 Tax=unclassified Cryobacterium TaxID=2649013 RepID=UPI00106DA22A|nr:MULTISPECIES: flagellar hook protein FlgE [unclassified Cryobacterium]MDY7527485.1 flagellar hook protein FlgE [Cryobacterium sp. 10C2]MDY7556727.1 flagellar hook protein FlgE [Cryobacterium sp. 10C3]MEB0002336.1 flagellar hook protein FlgE [Cryobacterium sp. RTC2.1]MEB0201418.1 flagellar hook protein FlgE [Cryobacterium sp. 5I3]MEB0286387.1 flagellar hook protein FlgE [Cryobacterium sp. 10S3]
MLRSLYSGISGLRAHQTMLDVTANNIANVNTTAFKSSSAQFQDTLSQLTHGAGSPQTVVGGTNPAQVGLGVQVAGISTNFAQGSTQSTGRATDMMISGDGFFVTQLAGETLFSRAGAFDFDAQGRLVSPSGALVQGWNADAKGTVNQGGALGTITLPLTTIQPPLASATATVTGNLPSDAADGTTLSREFTAYDKTGAASQVSLNFTYSAAAPAKWTVTSPNSTSSTMLTFADGSLTSTANSLPVTVNGVTVAVDLGTITGAANLSSLTAASTDGHAAGSLTSFTLGKDGTLTGLFSNGKQQSIGRIALATFTNPGGLEKAGSSEYRSTTNSGTAVLGAAGSAGMGTLTSGSLEMSNVDLSQEFTNLIVAQRGFQANARIITTSDEVLTELTNLKR